MSASLLKFRAGVRGFTLIEMIITLAIFALLAGAVFTLLTGVLQSTASLVDDQNHKDESAALNAFLKKKLGEMPPASTIVSYQRGDGEGLVQNGIIFGTVDLATAIDAKVQPNGYYTLRIANLAAGTDQGQTPQDARQVLQQFVITDDPTPTWTTLITDIKTLDWKFLDFNVTDWVELWGSTAKPNLVEFTMQSSGEIQPVTMDFWLPHLETIQLNITPAATAGTTSTTAAPATPAVAAPTRAGGGDRQR